MTHPLRARLKHVKDASMAAPAGLAYSKTLEVLFERFKKSVHKKYAPRMMEKRFLETDEDDLKRTIEATITIPGLKVIKKNAAKTYTLGAIRSTQFLNLMGIQMSYSRTPTDVHVIELIEERSFTELKDINEEMSERLVGTIAEGVEEGWGPEKIAKEIDETVDGIGRTRARLLARTETMRAFNEAGQTQYEKAGVEEVEWYTSHLENVCDECQMLDEHRFPINDHEDIPLHPNCACILLPVIETGLKESYTAEAEEE